MSVLAIPIATGIAELTIEAGAVLTEVFGTSLGTLIYGTAVGGTATKVASKIEEQTGATESLASYYDQAKAFYLAQELQDPNIFLNNQGRKSLPKNFSPYKKEREEILDSEDIEQKPEEYEDRNKVLETSSKNQQVYNYSPQDLLKVIYDISNKQSVSEEDLKTIIGKYRDTSPGYIAPLADIVLKYTGDIDTNIKNNEKYKEFERIFDMRNRSTQQFLSVENNYINENGNLYFIDELGNKLGPMEQGTQDQVHIPEVYGIYGGPQSRNYTNPIDIVDLAFFAHDLDFTVNGYLDYNSDLKLISRLNSLLNYNLVPEKSINLIKSIITYFSTAGLILDKIKGNAERPEDFTITNDDIFLDLRPDLAIDLDNQDNLEMVNDLKSKFFVELDYAKDDIITSSGSFQNISSENIINEIEFELENMLIQII